MRLSNPVSGPHGTRAMSSHLTWKSHCPVPPHAIVWTSTPEISEQVIFGTEEQTDRCARPGIPRNWGGYQPEPGRTVPTSRPKHRTDLLILLVWSSRIGAITGDVGLAIQRERKNMDAGCGRCAGERKKIGDRCIYVMIGKAIANQGGPFSHHLFHYFWARFRCILQSI